jgi:transcriptional regulator with XRE-family HTH domain
MSQAELARRLDVSAQAISSWIHSSTRPTRENLERAEDELAVKYGTLLGLADYSTNGSEPEPTIEALIRKDPGLDAEDKRVLLRMLAVLRQRPKA